MEALSRRRFASGSPGVDAPDAETAFPEPRIAEAMAAEMEFELPVPLAAAAAAAAAAARDEDDG
jgi:hypothetical protein